MASSGLTSGHYWDERYSVKNLRPILEGGTLEPANYYYQSLSYLPQAAVLAADRRRIRRLRRAVLVLRGRRASGRRATSSAG